MDKIGQFRGLGKNSHHLADLLLRSYGYFSNISLQIISSFLNLFIEALHSRHSSSLAFKPWDNCVLIWFREKVPIDCIHLCLQNLTFKSGWVERSKNIFSDLKPTELTMLFHFPVLWKFLCLTCAHGMIYVIVFSVITSDNYRFRGTLVIIFITVSPYFLTS